MAKFIVSIPDVFFNQAIEAVAVKFNYLKNNPLSKEQFAQQKIALLIMDILIDGELRKNRVAVEADLRSKITLTGSLEKP